MFRSDHYFIGPQQDSLEAYLSFAIVARVTSTIRFGPLVSPVTFRSPIDVGRMAAQIDGLSGGRFVMGVGAGWNESEHRAYGIHFPPVKERFDRLEESIQVIQKLWTEENATFDGAYYHLEGVNCLPKPANGRPPLLIGGGGEKRTLQLVAQYASEWNAVNITPETFAHKEPVLEAHCAARGSRPIDNRALDDVVRAPRPFARAHRRRFGSAVDVRRRTGEDVHGRISRLLARSRRHRWRHRRSGRPARPTRRARLQEVLFQHFDFDSDDVPEYLAAEIAPRVANF